MAKQSNSIVGITTNGFNEYKREIMYRLGVLTDQTTVIEKKIDGLKTDIIILKTKAIIYGSIAGFVIAAIFQGVIVLIKFI